MNKKVINKCKKLRLSLQNAIASRLSIENGYLANHIANCPRCQKRLLDLHRVTIAMSLIRSQKHSFGLLAKANTKAISVLSHTLREMPETEELKTAAPKISIWSRLSTPASVIGNVAACMLVVVLLKAGIFDKIGSAKEEGQKSIAQYYENRLGEDLANEIFNEIHKS